MKKPVVSTKSAKAKRGPLKTPRKTGRFKWILLASVIVVAGGIAAYLIWQWQWLSYRHRAIELANQGQYAQAEKMLLEVLDWAPDDVGAAQTVALLQRQLDRPYPAAERHLSRWCRLAPNDPNAFQLRMTMRLDSGKRKAALEDGLRTLELAPDKLLVRQNVAHLLLLAGRPSETEEHCRICLQKAPGNPIAQQLLAESYHAQGKSRELDALLQEMLRRRPKDPIALLLRGKRLCEQDNHKEAVPFLRRGLDRADVEHERQKARFWLSEALDRSNQKAEAKQIYAKFQQVQKALFLADRIALQPNDEELQLRAAKALIAAGVMDRAVGVLNDLLQKSPDHREARQLLRLAKQNHRTGGLP